MATLVSYDDTVSNTLNFGTTSTPYRVQSFLIPAGATITGVGIKGSGELLQVGHLL